MNALAKTSPAQAIQPITRKFDLVLEGRITTIDPINITRPLDSEEEKGLPTINVADGNGGFSPRPCIPGNTLRGLLRSRSGDLVRHYSGQRMLLNDFYRLYKGGIKGSAKESNDVLKAIEFRESNPVYGLYGMADPIWVGGCLSVGFAYPNEPQFAGRTSNSGVRGDPFKRNPDLLLELASSEVEAYADQRNFEKTKSGLLDEEKKLTKAKNKLFPKKKKGEAAAVEEWDRLDARLKEVEEKIAKMKEDNGSNTVGRPLPAVPAIAPGSILNSRIEVRAGLPTEIGLLLDTIELLSRNCRIGGKVNTGHGLFRASWDMKIAIGPVGRFEPAGTIAVGPEEFDLSIEHPILKECLDAWRALTTDPEALTVKSEAVEK